MTRVFFGGGVINSVVVDTIAQRDALSVPAGTRARVLSLPYVYEWDGAVWEIVDRGNRAMTALVSYSTIVVRFLDPATGDDEDDGLTAGTAWATAQRCVDEFAGQQFNGGGYIQIQCVGACNEPVPNFDALVDGTDTVFLYLVGDVAAAPLETFTMPVVNAQPLNPNDPNGGILYAQREYTITPWTTVIDEELYWLEGALTFLPGGDFVGGYNVLNECDNVAGTLKVGGTVDVSLSYAAMRLRPRTTIWLRQPGSFQTTINNNHQRWNVDFVGCDLTDGNQHTHGPVTAHACVIEEWRQYKSAGLLTFDSVVLDTCSFIDGDEEGARIGGIFLRNLDFWNGWHRLQGANLRYRARVGQPNGRATGTGLNIDNVDVHPNGSLDAFIFQQAIIKVGGSGGGSLSVGSPRRSAIRALDQSHVRIIAGRMTGATSHANSTIQVQDGSLVRGLTALIGQVTNEGAGAELEVGSVLGLSLSDVPVVDLDQLARAESL